MNELSFRGKDRFHSSWSAFAGVGLALVAWGVYAFFRFGVVFLGWLLGGSVVFSGIAFFLTFRSWTRVGAAGITICRGIGRGRTYSWQEIRWIDVRETDNRYGTARAARITLTNGRRRKLLALYHSSMYPNPDFNVDFQRVVNWWKSSTDPAARFQPPKRLRDRLNPVAVGIIIGFPLLVAIVALLNAVLH